MPSISKRFVSPKILKNIYDLLIKSFSKARGKDVLPFVSDLLTPTEQIMVAKRLAIAFLLLRKDYDIRGIASAIKVSTSTVSRVNMVLNTKGEGFRNILAKVQKDENLKIVLGEIYSHFTPLRGVDLEKSKNYRNKLKRELKSF